MENKKRINYQDLMETLDGECLDDLSNREKAEDYVDLCDEMFNSRFNEEIGYITNQIFAALYYNEESAEIDLSDMKDFKKWIHKKFHSQKHEDARFEKWKAENE